MIGQHALRLGVIVFAAGLAAQCVTGPVAGEDLSPPPVRVGVVGSLFRDAPEPLVQAMMRPFKSLMEAQTGLTSQVVVGGEAEQLGEQLARDKVQLGVFNGFEFAWARLKHPGIKPLIIAVNQRSHLKALLIVRADNSAVTIAGLQGKSLALPRLSREHTRLFLERRCLGCGQQPERLFAQITTPADLEDALDHVVDGVVQATVVDGVALENYQKRKPGRFAKLKVLQESETFPAAVVAYHPGGLTEASVKRFRDGMLSANQTRRGQQLLALCRMTGFEPIPDDYDQLLADIAKAYPPPTLPSK